MRWGYEWALWLSIASAVAASKTPVSLRVPGHAAVRQASGHLKVSLSTSSFTDVSQLREDPSDLSPDEIEENSKKGIERHGEVEKEMSKSLLREDPSDLSPDEIEENSKKGIERHGEVEKEMSTKTVEAEKEVANTATSIQNQARSYVVHVIFFVGVFLILCCCVCCLFYLPRKDEHSLNPIIDVVKEDRLKLQTDQPKYVSDVVNSIQFQSWSDSFFDKYAENGTMDLKELRDVIVELYGRDVESHWIFVRAHHSTRPERITCDEFLEVMMYFECKQYEDKRHLSTIPGLVMAGV